MQKALEPREAALNADNSFGYILVIKYKYSHTHRDEALIAHRNVELEDICIKFATELEDCV